MPTPAEKPQAASTTASLAEPATTGAEGNRLLPPQAAPLQALANQSPQVRQLQSYQSLANRRPVAQRMVVQRQGDPNGSAETGATESAEAESEGPQLQEAAHAAAAEPSSAASSSGGGAEASGFSQSLSDIKLSQEYKAGTGKVKQKIEALRIQFNEAKKGDDKAVALGALLKKVRKNIKEKKGAKGNTAKLAELKVLEAEIMASSKGLLKNEDFIKALKEDAPGAKESYSSFLEERYLNTKLEGRILEEHEISGLSIPNPEVDPELDGASLEYIKQGKYKDWLQLPPPKRLLISSILVTLVRNPQKAEVLGLDVERLKKTPAYGMGISMSGEDKEAVREHTKNYWLATFDTDEASADDPAMAQQNAHTLGILKKVFLLLQAGLEENTGQAFQPWSENVATALSHGGRVNIKIPKLTHVEGNNDPHALMNWLGVTQGGGATNTAAGAFVRGFGSHRLDANAKGEMKEKGGTMVGALGAVDNTKRYGLNLSVGGFGNFDFNGEIIKPDGKNGHMYIGFHPPTFKSFGTLQIGVETTAPGAPSNVGYHHTFRSTEATANPLSSVGGAKSDKHGQGKLGWNQIDLTTIQPQANAPIVAGVQSWFGRLKQISDQFELGKKQGVVGHADLLGTRAGFAEAMAQVKEPPEEDAAQANE